MVKLLTKNDLSERWQVSTKSIDNWVKDGLVTPCKKVPGDVRFSPKHIAELEGVELEKFSPLERRRLEKECEEWKIRAQKSESALAEINIMTAKIMYLKENMPCK